MDSSGAGDMGPFARMLATLREPLLLVSRSGVVRAANIVAAEALGTQQSALVGTALSAHARESDDLDVRISEAVHGEAAVPLCTRDGRRFSCHASVVDADLLLIRLSGGPDPATRARTFFEMLPRLQPVAGGESPTIEELVLALLPFGISSVRALMGGVYLLDADGKTLELAGSIDYRPDAQEAFRLVPMLPESAWPLPDSVRERRPVYLLSKDDYQQQYPRFLEQYPWVHDAIACLPLVVDDRCIGALAFGADWPWHIGDADRVFLDAFALQCALTVDRARRVDHGKEPRDHELVAERFQRLHAFTGALASAISFADVAEVAVDAAMAATGAQSGGLWMVDDSGDSVSLVRAVGPTGPRPEHHTHVPLDRPSRMPILDAIQSGKPVWIESCYQLELRYPAAFAAFSRGGESSLVCIPLLSQARCIGGLALNFGHAHRLREHERAFFQMIAWYAAQALERARLYAVEQRGRSAAEARQRRSAFLAESDAVLATLDYQSIVLSIASVAVPRIADWCIVEIEEDRRQGRPAIAMHADPAKTALVLELSARYREEENPALGIPAVVRTGRSQLHPTITPELIRASIRDAELAELGVALGAASSMVVPITARGQTLGALALSSAAPTRRYDEDDLAMAEELGRKVGLAIENARLYRDAREADRLKDEFLAMLSHELRTPLVPIVAAVDLMALNDGEQFVQERGLIQRNADHLVRLVDDLLDVSRITRGKISLSQEYCDVADLVHDGIELAYPLIEQAQHRLLITAPRQGAMVFADRVRIAQAIANLLTNAAKYTEPGGTITVTAEAEAGSARISVRDTGIGIAPDVITRIFDIFVQAPDTQLARKGGLGIGLTIVKRIVELHAGSVSANSAGIGQGTELVITLPLTTAEQRIATKPLEPPLAIVGGHVLVVDDNHDAATAIAELTAALGFSPHVAHDGFAALELATNVTPDLAFLDLGLPKMDGYELARQLRVFHPSLRIVALTGFGQPSDRERSQRAGFADHIVKPVTLDELRRLVRRLAE